MKIVQDILRIIGPRAIVYYYKARPNNFPLLLHLLTQIILKKKFNVSWEISVCVNLLKPKNMLLNVNVYHLIECLIF